MLLVNRHSRSPWFDIASRDGRLTVMSRSGLPESASTPTTALPSMSATHARERIGSATTSTGAANPATGVGAASSGRMRRKPGSGPHTQKPSPAGATPCSAPLPTVHRRATVTSVRSSRTRSRSPHTTKATLSSRAIETNVGDGGTLMNFVATA